MHKNHNSFLAFGGIQNVSGNLRRTVFLSVGVARIIVPVKINISMIGAFRSQSRHKSGAAVSAADSIIGASGEPEKRRRIAQYACKIIALYLYICPESFRASVNLAVIMGICVNSDCMSFVRHSSDYILISESCYKECSFNVIISQCVKDQRRKI